MEKKCIICNEIFTLVEKEGETVENLLEDFICEECEEEIEEV